MFSYQSNKLDDKEEVIKLQKIEVLKSNIQKYHDLLT